MNTTIGGDRLGSGSRSQQETTHYNRSTHDLSYLWRSSAAAGTLIPFMSQAALPGDTWDIDLNCEVMTLPTIGPLFGSYKVQLDVFEVPIRLYNGKLHMNLLNVGMDMSQIKLPQVLLGAINGTIADDSQINPSSIMSYLGVRGIGRNASGQTNDVTRQFNAVPLLAYYDIFKNYYANKQEEKAYYIHNPMNYASGAVITSFLLINQGASTTFADIKTGAGTISNPTLDFNAIIYADLGSAWTGQEPQIDFNHAFIVGSGTTRSINQMWQNTKVTYYPTYVRIDCWGYRVPYAQRPASIAQLGATAQVNYTKLSLLNNQPKLTAFNLSQIDEMRLWLLTNANTPNALQINNAGLEPYKSMLPKVNGNYPMISSQEGLMVKTYQSDLFNNWIKTEWINGPNGIAEITQVDTQNGYFTIDTLNLASKVYSMLNQIAISGGSYDDWLDAVYTHERPKAPENPVYHGSLIKELSFEEVIANSASKIDEVTKPLGTLAGRGRLTSKNKGGKIVIKCNEPSYIIGIVSLTPRVDYSQGNSWDMNLKTIDDFHKPALDAIAYQDLITDQLLWSDTEIVNLGGINYVQYSSLGKQPAWLNYMTNVNKTFGSFAIQENSMYMTLNRRYERNANGSLKDGTTYIDPVKFNQIFAESAIDAQNFWVQISNNITCRRKMSAKQIPNL